MFNNYFKIWLSFGVMIYEKYKSCHSICKIMYVSMITMNNLLGFLELKLPISAIQSFSEANCKLLSFPVS